MACSRPLLDKCLHAQRRQIIEISNALPLVRCNCGAKSSMAKAVGHICVICRYRKALALGPMTNACAARLLAFHFESQPEYVCAAESGLLRREVLFAPIDLAHCTLRRGTVTGSYLVAFALPHRIRRVRLAKWCFVVVNHWLSYSVLLCAHASQSATVWLRSFQDWEETINHNFVIHF